MNGVSTSMGIVTVTTGGPPGRGVPVGGATGQVLAKLGSDDYDTGWISVGGTGASAYVHTQSTPATTWTINHNLGFRPSVELLDSGSQEIDADVSHPSANQTVVTLKLAIAGLARLT